MSKLTPRIDPALLAACARPGAHDACCRLVRAVVAALGDNPGDVRGWRLKPLETAVIVSLELCPPDAQMGPWFYVYAIVCDTGQVAAINWTVETDPPRPPRLTAIQGGRAA